MSPPHMSFFGEVDSARGRHPKINPYFLDPTKNLCPPVRLWKNCCPCILEGHLSTNHILSALHLQGPKPNIYVHFHWVNKQSKATHVCMWYIVAVWGSMVILDISILNLSSNWPPIISQEPKTTTIYHKHHSKSNICMHVVHSGTVWGSIVV